MSRLDQLRTLLSRAPVRSGESLNLYQIAEKALDLAHELSQALELFSDASPCRFDHNNSCQEHGFFYLGPDEECPQVSLRRLLGAGDEETGRGDQEVKGTTPP